MPDRIGKARSQMTRYRRLGRGGECCARACNDFRARRNGKGLRRQALRKCVEGPRHLSCRTQPGTEGSNPSPSSEESDANLALNLQLAAQCTAATKSGTQRRTPGPACATPRLALRIA